MPDAIAEARRALEREQADLQAQLDRIETALTALTGLGPPSRPRPSRRAGRPDRLPRGALAEAIVEVLQGAPRGGMHGDEVLAAVQRQGAAPRGANPRASVANALQRLAGQGKVRKAGRNRWRGA